MQHKGLLRINAFTFKRALCAEIVFLLVAWQDFHHSYYPTTLPLRMPYSGNPGMLLDARQTVAVMRRACLSVDVLSCNSACHACHR